MYIKSRPIALAYRGLVALLSVVATWSLFVMLGSSAWRLFITWAVLFSSVYYVSSTLFAAVFGGRKGGGWTPAPTWQLATLIAFGLVTTEGLMGEGVSEVHGQIGLLIRSILPVLVLGDWLVFSKKGQFRVVDPWYSLALPACYAAWILMSAADTKMTWAYPYQNFEIAAVGVPTMLSWLELLAVIILLVGYIVYMVDFALSGKLSKYIVMPKIKLIEIPDDEPADSDVKQLESQPAESVKEKTITEPEPTSVVKPITVPKKTMDVSSSKGAKKPTKVIETKKSTTPLETVPVIKETKPLTSKKQEKVEQRVAIPTEQHPAAPRKPEEPQAPKIPQIENRKKDEKSAQSLHGKK